MDEEPVLHVAHEPPAVEYRPASHKEQDDADDAPVGHPPFGAGYVHVPLPAAQLVHCAAPKLSLYELAAHGMHVVAPEEA